MLEFSCSKYEEKKCLQWLPGSRDGSPLRGPNTFAPNTFNTIRGGGLCVKGHWVSH